MVGLFADLVVIAIIADGFPSLLADFRSLVHGPLVSPFKLGNSAAISYGLVCAVAAVWIAFHRCCFWMGKIRRPRRLVQSVGALRKQAYTPFDLHEFLGPFLALLHGVPAVVLLGLISLLRWLRPHGSPTSQWLWLALLVFLCQLGFMLAVLGFVHFLAAAVRQIAQTRGLPPPPMPPHIQMFHWTWILPSLTVPYLMLSQGVVVTCLFGAMITAFLGCLATRPAKWDWPRYVSLAGAVLLAGWSVTSDPSRIAHVVPWLRSGLSHWQGTSGEMVWAAIAVAAFLTCAASVLDLSPPVLRVAELLKLPAKDKQNTREAYIVWLFTMLIGTAVVLCGFARWPNDNGFYLLAAMVLGTTLRESDATSLAATVFFLIPRWTVWMLAARHTSWTGTAAFLPCEALFLLPTLHGSWLAWRLRNSPEAARKPKRRFRPAGSGVVVDWIGTPCRISVVLARSAPRAVVLRSGPRDSAQLTLWHTDTDQFVSGDSLKGYVSGRRCDLSPDGTEFVYFVRPRGLGHNGQLLPGWTAVCKPPDPTPLTLWKKAGESEGGGVFVEGRPLRLYHSLDDAQPAQGIAMEIEPYHGAGDRGIYSERLRQRGWAPRLEHGGHTEFPPLWQKHDQTLKYLLQECFKQSPGEGIALELCLTAGDPTPHRLDAEWADWDHRNRLVAVRGTSLCAGQVLDNGEVAWTALADFKDGQPQSFGPAGAVLQSPR